MSERFGQGLFLLLVLGLGCAAPFGAYMAWTEVREQGLALRRGVETKAIILRSEVRRFSDEAKPHIEYKYRVNDRWLHSDRVAPYWPVYKRGGWAEEAVARYRPGTEITAWYDPAQPARVFIDRRVEGSLYGFMVLLLMFSGVIPGGALLITPSGRWSRLGWPMLIAGLFVSCAWAACDYLSLSGL